MKLRVINLDRRSDRWIQIRSQLRELPAENVLRISAIDAKSGISLDSRLVSRGNVACWLSHQICFQEQIQNSEEWTVVLEDDADFHVDISTQMLDSLIQKCQSLSIDVLQLGWIEIFYRPLSPRWLLDMVLASRAGRRIGGKGGQGLSIVLGEFRAGSHAYLISKNGAEKLLGTNVPAVLGADAFLSAMAQNHYQDSGIKFARLSKSLAGQASRDGKSSSIDTDIFN